MLSDGTHSHQCLILRPGMQQANKIYESTFKDASWHFFN